MILGLRTAIVPIPDLAAGKAWYSRAFETPPYFDEPFYVGYRIGGFELGLTPDGTPGEAGAQPYWGTADIHAEILRLTQLGAAAGQPVTDVGGGILVGSVVDPFGNTLHLIQNPHFDPQAVH